MSVTSTFRSPDLHTHIDCLPPLEALRFPVADALPFAQQPTTVTFDAVTVHEDVSPPLIWRDEAVAPILVEPHHGAHAVLLPLLLRVVGITNVEVLRGANTVLTFV